MSNSRLCLRWAIWLGIPIYCVFPPAINNGKIRKFFAREWWRPFPFAYICTIHTYLYFNVREGRWSYVFTYLTCLYDQSTGRYSVSFVDLFGGAKFACASFAIGFTNFQVEYIQIPTNLFVPTTSVALFKQKWHALLGVLLKIKFWRKLYVAGMMVFWIHKVGRLQWQIFPVMKLAKERLMIEKNPPLKTKLMQSDKISKFYGNIAWMRDKSDLIIDDKHRKKYSTFLWHETTKTMHFLI